MKSILKTMAAVVLVAPFVANAQTTTTGTFQVEATVADSCSVTAGSAMAFSYDPFSSSATQSTTTFDVTCTKGASYAIDLTSANSWTLLPSDAVANTDSLTYGLFSDDSYSTTWNGTTTVGGTGTGGAETKTVYAQVAAAQTVSADTYRDTVTITVTY